MAHEIPKNGQYNLRIEAEIAHAALEAIKEANKEILEIVGQRVVNLGTDDEQLVVTIRNYNLQAVLEILSEVRDEHEVKLAEFCEEMEEYDRGVLLSILESEAPDEFWSDGRFLLAMEHHFQYRGVSCDRCELGKGDCYTHRITFSIETAIERDDPELPEAARRYAMAQRNPASKAGAKANPKPEAEADPKAEAKANPKPEAEADPKAEAEADPKPEAEADPKAEAKADRQAGSQSRAQA